MNFPSPSSAASVVAITGLFRAERGAVRVFDRDPVADSVEVLGRIGYLFEQPDLPGWMRVDELLRSTRAFYPKWDADYAGQLRQQFGLDPGARLKTLSKGQQAKAGLLIAQAHRPDLLLLDEPSSGLKSAFLMKNSILVLSIAVTVLCGVLLVQKNREMAEIRAHLAAADQARAASAARGSVPAGPAAPREHKGASQMFHDAMMKEALQAEAKVAVARSVQRLLDAGLAARLQLNYQWFDKTQSDMAGNAP